MNTLFETNISYLKSNMPDLYNVIRNRIESDEASHYELITDGVLNIKHLKEQSKYLLYSKYDPTHESERWLESYDKDMSSNKNCILYGLGLTYHLAAILTKYPEIKIFIYEPEIDIFIEALKVISVETLFNHKNIVRIFVGKEDKTLSRFLEDLYYYAKFPIVLLDIPIYRTIDINYILKFVKAVDKINMQKIMITGFGERFGDITYINSIRNIPKLMSTPSIKLLKGQFKGCTALIVGGGPSLQYDIEYIKENRDHLFIIAAGSSIQSLMHFGVTPHMIVSMDPGAANANIFIKSNSKYNDIPLLYIPQIHHEIINIHSENNVFGYFSNDPIINYYIDIYNKDYLFEPTYSVTGTAIQAAIYMGADEIILAGQDLSFPGSQRYSPGASHFKHAGQSKAENELSEEVDNVVGGKNPTNLSMLKTKENIEELIQGYNNITFINTTSQGAVIKGSTYTPIREVLFQNNETKYDFEQIKDIIQNVSVQLNEDFSEVRAKTIGILKALDEYSRTSRRVLNKLDKLVQQSTINGIKAEATLRSIEDAWRKVVLDEVFIAIVEEWMVLDISQYDQKILDVFKETDIVKKAKLLQEVLGSFCEKLLGKLPIMKEEFGKILVNI